MKDLDDYVYYINVGLKVFEFLVVVVVFGYIVWVILIGEWNYIGKNFNCKGFVFVIC